MKTRTPAKPAATKPASKRWVTLPNGHKCSLGEYVRSWKVLNTMPANQDVAGFGHFPESVGSIRARLLAGLDDRINRHTPGYGKGRKWDADWQNTMARAARDLNTPRLRIHWLPLDLRAKFGHLLAGRDD